MELKCRQIMAMSEKPSLGRDLKSSIVLETSPLYVQPWQKKYQYPDTKSLVQFLPWQKAHRPGSARFEFLVVDI